MKFLVPAVAAGIFCTATSFAADWPQFLGPSRNGVSAETGLIDSFDSSGPRIVWRTLVGTGMSNVSVAGGTVFTMYQDSQKQYLVALDEKTGNQKWQVAVNDAYRNSMGDGPRATPAVHEDRVYSFSGEGLLSAHDAESGRILWTRNAVLDAGGKPSEYGMASSPLIVGKHVIVQVGGSAGAVAAYNIGSGQLAWAAGRGTAGYSSPVLMKLSGQEQVVAFVGAAAMGIRPADGTVIWTYDYPTDYDCNTASPVQLDDDSVLISSGENHGSTILNINADGDVKVEWASTGPRSVLRAEWQTAVLHDGKLYGFDNVGSAGPVTNMVCVNVSDGTQSWIQRRFGKANLTFADGRLYISTMKGELVIVSAAPDGFEETARATILESQTRQAPVIANGRLYLRDDNEVVCVNVKK